MAIYTEKQPNPVIAIIFLVLAFLMMYSLRQIGDRELYWNEGAHAVISQAISLDYPVSEIHGEATLNEFPLFHLLVSGLIKTGVPPTPLNARTGEFTPPGITVWALANNCSDVDIGFPITVVAKIMTEYQHYNKRCSKRE